MGRQVTCEECGSDSIVDLTLGSWITQRCPRCNAELRAVEVPKHRRFGGVLFDEILRALLGVWLGAFAAGALSVLGALALCPWNAMMGTDIPEGPLCRALGTVATPSLFLLPAIGCYLSLRLAKFRLDPPLLVTGVWLASALSLAVFDIDSLFRGVFLGVVVPIVGTSAVALFRRSRSVDVEGPERPKPAK